MLHEIDSVSNNLPNRFVTFVETSYLALVLFYFMFDLLTNSCLHFHYFTFCLTKASDSQD